MNTSFMRKVYSLLILLFPLFIFGQTTTSKDIMEKWKEVDRLISIGNYEQTRPLLTDIKAYAIRQKDNPLFMRVFLAESTILRVNQTEEGRFELGQNHFHNYLHQSKDPILQSLLTNFYAQFLEANLYIHFSDSKNSFLKLSQDKRRELIDSLYQKSLTAKPALLKQKIATWDTLFVQKENMSLTPTLYHYVASQYLEFLNSSSANKKQRNNFLDDLIAVSKQGKYADALSCLLAEKINKNERSAKAFEQAYEKIIAENKSDYNAFLYYEIAVRYQQEDKLVDALRITSLARDAYPKSKWLNNVINLENEIKRPDLHIRHKNIEPAESYTPIHVDHKNMEQLYIRVYKTPNGLKSYKEGNVQRDSISQLITVNADLTYEENLKLKPFSDYKRHQTIYKLNPLHYGSYVILFSNNKEFKDDGLFNRVSESNIAISDVYMTPFDNSAEEDKKQQQSFMLLNRKTGLPYANKKLDLYRITDGKPEKMASIRSDKNGLALFTANTPKIWNALADYTVYIPEEKQLLELDELGESYYRNMDEDEAGTNAMILTDRAIYRPGQTLHYKVILYNNDPKKGKVLPEQKFTLKLFGANGQQIDSVELKSNAYGSGHGAFNIPTEILNGRAFLQVFVNKERISSSSITVEEYKRPTFKVEFERNTATYKHEDTAIFKGKAMMLSGAPLINATVKYSVKISSYGRQYKNFTLIDSSLLSGPKGQFEIRIPLSDTALQKLEDFQINIQADVINQTGEMQSSSAYYSFRSKPWNLYIQSPPLIGSGKWKEIQVHTNNPNGEKLPMQGTVHIYRLDTGDKAISNEAKNYFTQAEYHLLSTSEYEKYFPKAYDKKQQKDPKKILIATYSFDSKDTSLVKIDSNLFTPGSYSIEAESIQGKDSIKAQAITHVFDVATKKYNKQTFLNVSLDKEKYTIGEAFTVNIQSDVPEAKGAYLLRVKNNQKEIVAYLPLKDGKASYSSKITLDDTYPAIDWTVFMMVNNQAEYQAFQVPLSREDKKITIKTSTFRDKITPGQKEKWSFTILSKSKDQSAEVLASMYDASLNKFQELYYDDSFELAHRYQTVHFYNLLSQFQQQVNSYQQFGLQPQLDYMGGYLPLLNNYNFWNSPQLQLRGAVTLQANAEVRHNGFSQGLVEKTAGVSLDEIVVNGISADASFKRNVTEETVAQDKLDTQPNQAPDLSQVQARSNLQETAFFFPTLYSDQDGQVSFEFDSPEALTQWKLMLFAHQKDLHAGTASFYSLTQKELMLRPNLPRYFREGDEITLKAQVQNLSKDPQQGSARLEFINPINNQVISDLFLVDPADQAFQVSGENNKILNWKVKIPAGYPSIQVKMVAASQAFSDGEILELAILPNQVLITDTEKIILDGKETKDYTLSGQGKENLQAKIQLQSNPILEIISALDYLNNYPYECTEQTSSKWFGIKMVEYISKHYPAIATYFKEIKARDTQGRLEANSSLASLTLQEMPWLRDVQGDEKKLQALADLFNSNLQSQLRDLESKLFQSQLENGAFPWFQGGKANTDISVRILEVTGKVLRLDISLVNAGMQQRMQRLLTYLDADTVIFKPKASSETALNYLYARHYWNGLTPLSAEQAQKLKAKIAQAPLITANSPAGNAARAWVVNQLFGAGKESQELKNRIQQEAIFDKDRGTYWPSNDRQYNSISLQSYLVEAYKLIDPSKLMEITQWLYYKKEANYWRSTWMTVDAIYALLLANNPQDFVLSNSVQVLVDQQAMQLNEAFLGQVSKQFSAEELVSNKTLKVKNENDRRIYGGLYHQYFLPVEQVQGSVHELRISKEYLVERQGKWVVAKQAKLGERIKVRITLINDKPLQYVHVKDSRPSGVEPIYQPSGYKWYMGYYFTLKDASTNYFFDFLPKGKRTLEYEVTANNIGLFNSGISQVECMYDPTVNSRASNVQLEIIE